MGNVFLLFPSEHAQHDVSPTKTSYFQNLALHAEKHATTLHHATRARKCNTEQEHFTHGVAQH